MTNIVTLTLGILCVCSLAACPPSSAPAYIDFTYDRATPNSWQPADISTDFGHPLVYGNHLLLRDAHLIDGLFTAYPSEDARQVTEIFI